MPSHHRIKGRDILNDIRSGLTAAELMAKYEISSQLLDAALEQLVNARVLSRDEIRRWLSESTRKLLDRDRPRTARNHPILTVHIQEKNAPNRGGVIRDITEEMVGIIGIQSRLDEIKTFEIVPNGTKGLSAFDFEAKCRWIKKGADGQYVGGFKITRISEGCLDMLRKVIEKLTSGRGS